MKSEVERRAGLAEAVPCLSKVKALVRIGRQRLDGPLLDALAGAEAANV